jgi:hypothetical protein
LSTWSRRESCRKWKFGILGFASAPSPPNPKYQISIFHGTPPTNLAKASQEFCRKWKFGILGSAAESKIPNFHFLQNSWVEICLICASAPRDPS